MLDVASFTFEFDVTALDGRQWEIAFSSYMRNYLLFPLIATLIVDAMRNRIFTSVCWLVAERAMIRPLARFVNWYYIRTKQPRAWVRLDEYGLIYVTRPNQRVYERPMSQILTASEFDEFFAFRSTKGIFCIPKRAFASDSDTELFRRFLRNRLGRRCRLAVA